MVFPFDEGSAYEECRQMIKEIENGFLRIETCGRVSEERAGQGVMLGALLCRNDAGEKVVLRTVSGISKKLVPVQTGNEIYVPPVVSASEIDEALAKNDRTIHELTAKINLLKEKRKLPDGKYSDMSAEEKELVEERGFLCMESQKKVFDLYSFFCADLKKRSLREICGAANFVRSGNSVEKLPPTGTGDCCAPKLLNYAYGHALVPFSICEVFYGAGTVSKTSGIICEPCEERCALILPEMLGLKILYRDKDIVVVDKQSGLLSVPGRGPDKQDCIVNRLKRLFPECIEQPSVHRLDMETSGLMVLALNAESQRNLRIQFEKSEIRKKYIAVLDGNLLKKGIDRTGSMELYFRLDVDNRPHQIWDDVYGKKAVTQWQILGIESYTAPNGQKRSVTRVEFVPLTGRTHQLRLASADSHGFGVPIVGDSLYGTCAEGERLLLHACCLAFVHPATGMPMEFDCKSPF